MGRRRKVALALAGAATALLVTGCTPAPSTTAEPSAPASSVAPSSPSSSASSSPPAATGLQIDIQIEGDSVSPSGKKINIEVGDTVTLNVTSDIDDEIHAHTDGDGFELEVASGKTTSGSFVINEPGSFEVESHHLEKTIVILNAR